jgi:hypothetical protein
MGPIAAVAELATVSAEPVMAATSAIEATTGLASGIETATNIATATQVKNLISIPGATATELPGIKALTELPEQPIAEKALGPSSQEQTDKSDTEKKPPKDEENEKKDKESLEAAEIERKMERLKQLIEYKGAIDSYIFQLKLVAAPTQEQSLDLSKYKVKSIESKMEIDLLKGEIESKINTVMNPLVKAALLATFGGIVIMSTAAQGSGV